jgi:hypothetical protein
MTNQERLSLADRVQKKLQKLYPQYRFVRRRERIKKAMQEETKACKTADFERRKGGDRINQLGYRAQRPSN